MSTLVAPHDVVIREEQRDGVLHFVFYVGDAVPQFAWSDEETAIRTATRFAAEFHVSAWWKVGERDYLLLKACRPKEESASGPALHAALLNRLRGQYMEMPGLALTMSQVQRLCGVDASICKALLAALVDARFLRLTGDGKYQRATDGAWPELFFIESV
jgi:hypothetical protein